MSSESVRITIDGREVSAERGRPVLEAIRAAGIDLPTLCYHPALEPYGACRLCLVELTGGNGSGELVAACATPAEEGMALLCDSETAERARRLSMRLILARCPEVESLWRFAEGMGVTDTPFERGDDDCIMCGLCERVCRELIGCSVVAFLGRGSERTVRSPFDGASKDCIGCEACVAVCPTGKVKARLSEGRLVFDTWKTPLDLAPCPDCGRPYAPERLLAHVGETADAIGVDAALCPACRRKSSAERHSQAVRAESAMPECGKPAANKSAEGVK